MLNQFKFFMDGFAEEIREEGITELNSADDETGLERRRSGV